MAFFFLFQEALESLDIQTEVPYVFSLNLVWMMLSFALPTLRNKKILLQGIGYEIKTNREWKRVNYLFLS